MTTYASGIIGRQYQLPRVINFTEVAVSRNCTRCHEPAGRLVVPIAEPIATCPSCGHQWRVRVTDQEVNEFRRRLFSEVLAQHGGRHMVDIPCGCYDERGALGMTDCPLHSELRSQR